MTAPVGPETPNEDDIQTIDATEVLSLADRIREEGADITPEAAAYQRTPLFPWDGRFDMHAPAEMPWFITDPTEFIETIEAAVAHIEAVSGDVSETEHGNRICPQGLGHLFLRLFRSGRSIQVEGATVGQTEFALAALVCSTGLIGQIRQQQQAQQQERMMRQMQQMASEGVTDVTIDEPGTLILPPGIDN